MIVNSKSKGAFEYSDDEKSKSFEISFDMIKSEPTHKLTLPKGTIIKSIKDGSPDLILYCDVDVDCFATHELEYPEQLRFRMDNTFVEIWGRKFPVLIKEGD